MTNRVVILDLNEDDIDTPSILTAVQNGTDLYSLQNNNISLSVYDPIPPVVTLSG